MTDGPVSPVDQRCVTVPLATPLDRTPRTAWAPLGLLFLLLLAGLWFAPKSWLRNEKANRAVCNKTLRAIGVSIQFYFSDNHNQMPTDLEALAVSMDVTPGVLVCPSSNDERAAGPTTRAMWQSFRQPGHCSYKLASPLPASLGDVTPSHVLAYELTTANHGDGAHVLFGDGRVDFLPTPEFERVVAELKAGFNPPRKGN